MERKAIMAPDKGIDRYLPLNLIDDGAWSDGNNVQFGVGYVKKVSGWRKFFGVRSVWAGLTVYAEGVQVVPTTVNNHVYKCTIAGTSGDTEPTWPTTYGATVTDGTAVWTEVGVNKLDGTVQTIDNYYKSDNTEWLMFVTTGGVYYYHDSEDTAVKIGTLNGTMDHLAQTENAQDLFIITNNVDPVKYWDGAASAIADLPGLDNCEPGYDGVTVTSVRAKCICYYNGFLILGDTTENGYHKPQRLRWCRISDITNWKNNDDGTGQAGWLDLTDGVDWVQAMRPLGDYLVAYKERSIQVMSYVGGDLIFDRRSAIIGTGLLATHALCDLGDEHVFVGPDNIYSFDGIETKIAGDAVAKDFFRLMLPNAANLTKNFFIEEVPEAWFSFVSVDSASELPDRAIVYNTDTKSWSWRDTPMLAYGYYRQRSDLAIDDMDFAIDDWDTEIDSSSSLVNAPLNIAGDVNGNIYVLDGNSFDGAAIDSFVVSKMFDFEQPGLIKRLLRIQLMVAREGPYMLPITVYAADNADDLLLSPVGAYNMNLDKTYPPWVDLDLSARYFAIKLGTKNAGEPFKLTGFILYYELRGEI